MSRPVDYTDPSVLTTGVEEGWAESVIDPTEIDWPERQARAAIPFEVRNGRPVNPCEKTYVQRGRNNLGLWGENLMADAIVVGHHCGISLILMVERDDGRGWAIPGGGVEPGESPAAAAARELVEETGLVVPGSLWRPGEPTYVPDPRASDEAWAVTVPAYADLGPIARLPKVTGSDDARRAAWVRAGTFQELTFDLMTRFDGGEVFPAHVDLLRRFFADQPKHPYYVVYAVTKGAEQRIRSTVIELPFKPATGSGVRELSFRLPRERGTSEPVVVNWLSLKEAA